MFSYKGRPPTLVKLLFVLTGCCIARGSVIPSPNNGTDGTQLLNNSLVLSPTSTATGCTNLEGLLESFGSIGKQLNLTTMAVDISGQVTYAFESTNRSLIRKVLSATRRDSGSEDWTLLSPSVSSVSLLGVISLSRGVPPPASSINATRLGAAAAPTLLATLAGSHCIFGVAIDAAQAVYSTSRYMGSCETPNDRDGTFDDGTFDSPRYLVLTRSSRILYVVELDAIRVLDYATNRLRTPLRMSSEESKAVTGAFLSPDEQTLFLPLRDGKILRANALGRSFGKSLLLTAAGIGGGSNFVAFAAAAALGTGGQVGRVVTTVDTAVTGTPCPEERYVLATRNSLAVAIVGTPLTQDIPLNVTWSTNATVLCAAVHSDGRSLLLVTSRDAIGARPAASIEYLLLMSSSARTLARSSDASTASSSTTTPASASPEDTTLSSLPSSLSVTSDAAAVSITAAATLVGSSTASQAHDGNNRSSAAAAAAAAVSEPSEAASTLAAVGGGSVVLPSSINAYPAVADDHASVVLATTICTGIVCACLLAAGSYMLVRRVRWSLLWKNRRLLVKLGPQGDDIILVPPGECDRGIAAANGGYDCAVAVDCAKDPVAVSSVLQQQQQQQP